MQLLCSERAIAASHLERFFLLACAGAFRARRNQLWQLVMSRRGVPGGYASVR